MTALMRRCKCNEADAAFVLVEADATIDIKNKVRRKLFSTI